MAPTAEDDGQEAPCGVRVPADPDGELLRRVAERDLEALTVSIGGTSSRSTAWSCADSWAGPRTRRSSDRYALVRDLLVRAGHSPELPDALLRPPEVDARRLRIAPPPR